MYISYKNTIIFIGEYQICKCSADVYCNAWSVSHSLTQNKNVSRKCANLIYLDLIFLSPNEIQLRYLLCIIHQFIFHVHKGACCQECDDQF